MKRKFLRKEIIIFKRVIVRFKYEIIRLYLLIRDLDPRQEVQIENAKRKSYSGCMQLVETC